MGLSETCPGTQIAGIICASLLQLPMQLLSTQGETLLFSFVAMKLFKVLC